MPAPIGNRNAVRHGLRGTSLAKPYSYLRGSVDEFRRDLEDAVVATRGEITLQDACHICTAYRWERASQIFQAMLGKMKDGKGRELTTDQLIACTERSARASEARDRAVRALDLDTKRRGNGDGWDMIQATVSEGSDDDGDTGQGMPETPQDAVSRDAGQPEGKQTSDATDAVDGRTGRDDGPDAEDTK